MSLTDDMAILAYSMPLRPGIRKRLTKPKFTLPMLGRQNSPAPEAIFGSFNIPECLNDTLRARRNNAMSRAVQRGCTGCHTPVVAQSSGRRTTPRPSSKPANERTNRHVDAAKPPPLIKAYLRRGAWVGGPPVSIPMQGWRACRVSRRRPTLG